MSINPTDVAANLYRQVKTTAVTLLNAALPDSAFPAPITPAAPPGGTYNVPTGGHALSLGKVLAFLAGLKLTSPTPITGEWARPSTVPRDLTHPDGYACPDGYNLILIPTGALVSSWTCHLGNSVPTSVPPWQDIVVGVP